MTPSESEGCTRPTSTFVFVDLAGYTALTEAHGDEQAADIAGELIATVRGLLCSYAVEEVKTIGDAVMLRAEEPEDALRICGRIMAELGDAHGRLGIRIGMSTGPAVEREGDWFGASVNLASRVADLAEDGEILLTDATRTALGDSAPFELAARGKQTLKNVGRPIPIFAAERAEGPGRELVVDPVCRMSVDPERSARSIEWNGTYYEFCSNRCADAFAASPAGYAAAD